MSVTLTLNRKAPEIREWCLICNRYEPHANGSLQVPVALNVDAMQPEQDVTSTPSMRVDWRCATQCLRCAWVTIYR